MSAIRSRFFRALPSLVRLSSLSIFSQIYISLKCHSGTTRCVHTFTSGTAVGRMRVQIKASSRGDYILIRECDGSVASDSASQGYGEYDYTCTLCAETLRRDETDICDHVTSSSEFVRRRKQDGTPQKHAS